MNKIKIDCPECGKSVTTNNITKHLNSKSCEKEKSGIDTSLKIDESWKNQNGLYSCPHCSKEYSKYGIGLHIWRAHGDGINFTANNDGYKDGTKTIWNKGLTKETDIRLKQAGEKHSNKLRNGELIHSWTGRKHTAETKQKFHTNAVNRNLGGHTSKKSLHYTTKSGDQVYLQSSYEITVAQNLDNADVVWTRPEPLLWIDSENKKHRYYPDFYLPDLNVYLDPKNDYLIIKDAEKINSVMTQNNVKILILSKNQLTWEFIKTTINQLS